MLAWSHGLRLYAVQEAADPYVRTIVTMRLTRVSLLFYWSTAECRRLYVAGEQTMRMGHNGQ